MKVLHTVAGVWQHSGGPAASVPPLCEALVEAGCRVVLLAGAGPMAESVLAARHRVDLTTERLGPYWLAHFSSKFARACRQQAESCDLLHTHGLWLFPNWVTARVAIASTKPLVVSVRGMLEPWALMQSRRRKALVMQLFERRHLETAAFLHATSTQELVSLRSAGLSAPVAVIPNGVDGRDLGRTRPPSGDCRPFSSGSRRKVLFLSRIHPKKGIDLLLDVWKVAVPEDHAELLLAGPGAPSDVGRLEKRLSREARTDIRYIGPVEGEAKLNTLERADIVILPSYSENYGMVVAEALASGTPVITTTETPWEELPQLGCGWWVRPTVDDLSVALNEALALPSETLLEMGQRGLAWIEQEHSIGRSARKMLAAYRWALGEASRPEFVDTVGRVNSSRVL